MIILWIILWIVMALLCLVLAILLWALLVPFRLEVNSESEVYRCGIPGLIMARAEPEGDFFLISFRIFFLNFRMDPFKPSSAGKEKEEAEKEKKEAEKDKEKKKSKSVLSGRHLLKPSLKLLKDIFKAIKLKRLVVDFDTGDDILNAKLYPVCFILSRPNRHVMVNFDDFQRIIIEIRTRLIWFALGGVRFAWRAYVKPKLKFIKS